MYRNILVGLDGSFWSQQAMQAALALGMTEAGTRLIGCHVYAAQMHRARFEQMEPGLPDQYQEEERRQDLRQTHDSLISTGMKLISDAYLAPLQRQAEAKGLEWAGLTPQGRNYVEMLRAARQESADLLVAGGWGHGRVPESQLGSVAERILLQSPEQDVLLVKGPWAPRGRPIVVGIDGSAASYAALHRAMELGAHLDSGVEAVAVYDPYFHTGVFRATADALPEEAAQRFNFPAQERLHDEIIDHGLEKLYRAGLERAAALASGWGSDIRTEVLAGKVYAKIHHYAALREASLVVIGRWGLHHEDGCAIGSNALGLARLATSGSVLVVAPPPGTAGRPEAEPPDASSVPADESLPWAPEAEARLRRVPFFVRRMARAAIERYARQQGVAQVTPEMVQAAAGRFGMGR